MGDLLAVSVTSESAEQLVHVAAGEAAYDNHSLICFFRAGALLRMPCGKGAAFVSPHCKSVDGDDHLELQEDTCLFLPLQVGVRRAVALHACDDTCKPDVSGSIVHGTASRWNLLGRRTGYPSRSA